MYFAEIAAMPAILFSSKLQLVKPRYIQLSGYIFGNLDGSIMFLFKIMFIESLESDVAVISRICGRIFNRLTSWI